MKKWLVAGAIGVIVATGMAFWTLRNGELTPADLSQMPQREQNLAVYDAFLANLDRHYFDPAMLRSPEWIARFAEYREKAAAAPSRFALYADVFLQLGLRFPHSHVGAMMPGSSESIGPAIPPAAGSAPKKPPDRAQVERTLALLASGPGFDIAQVRRGGNAMWMVVGDIIAASPADRAGIEPGWGLSSYSYNTDATGVHFKGEFLKFTQEQALRRDRSLEIELPASATLAYDFELLPVRPSFDTALLEGGVTYVRFDNFKDATLVNQALVAIDAAGPEGLIVDLRHNSGGWVSEMIRVAGRLLGPDAYIGADRKNVGVVYNRTDDDTRGYRGPLAVLIGPSTASAAEVAAAAVQDNKRGVVIGRTSNGSVLTSYYLPLPDGGQMSVPAMEFMRSGDRRIEGVGVAPDIVVMPALADVRAGRDPVIERALAEIARLEHSAMAAD